jgi:hypothetical protein
VAILVVALVIYSVHQMANRYECIDLFYFSQRIRLACFTPTQ